MSHHSRRAKSEVPVLDDILRHLWFRCVLAFPFSSRAAFFPEAYYFAPAPSVGLARQCRSRVFPFPLCLLFSRESVLSLVSKGALLLSTPLFSPRPPAWGAPALPLPFHSFSPAETPALAALVMPASPLPVVALLEVLVIHLRGRLGANADSRPPRGRRPGQIRRPPPKSAATSVFLLSRPRAISTRTILAMASAITMS